jgi:hypothetical protein
MRVLQIQNTRSQEEPRQPGGHLLSVTDDQNLMARIRDAAEVYARASALFEYARGLSDTPDRDINFRDLIMATKQMGVFVSDQAALLAHIEKYGTIFGSITTSEKTN